MLQYLSIRKPITFRVLELEGPVVMVMLLIIKIRKPWTFIAPVVFMVMSKNFP